jgi:hypothetical protein
MANSNSVLGVSSVFKVKDPNLTIQVSSLTSYQGQELQYIFSSNSGGVVFGYDRDIFVIVSANVSSNYHLAPAVGSYIWRNGLNNLFLNTTKVRSAWSAGLYKAVVSRRNSTIKRHRRRKKSLWENSDLKL